MAMNGLSQSASDSMEPVARSSERCGARSKPFLMMSERIVIYDLRLAIYEFNIGRQYNRARAECHAIANCERAYNGTRRSVAQIGNLPCRWLATGGSFAPPAPHPTRIANPRYSRLPVGATSRPSSGG